MRYKLCVPVLLVVILCCASCNWWNDDPPDRDYRGDMRSFVIQISDYAHARKAPFIVIPQNGVELVTLDGEHGIDLAQQYLDAIDGLGQEDLRYGYTQDNDPTPDADRDWLIGFLNLARDQGKRVLVTDYCSSHDFVDDSYQQNLASGFISFAADHRDLDNIPLYPALPFHNNLSGINALNQAQNYLYLIDPENFSSPGEFVASLDATNFDCLIIDAFFEDIALTPAQIDELRSKPNGSRRLVIAYMSIGEAEDYRFYWQPSWDDNPPSWLADENPDWDGNYKVRYWDPAWQAIIYGSPSAYLDRIIMAGFDGVYLDIIDAFEYFEDRSPNHL